MLAMKETWEKQRKRKNNGNNSLGALMNNEHGGKVTCGGLSCCPLHQCVAEDGLAGPAE